MASDAATAAAAASNGGDGAHVYSLDEMRKHTTEESCWIAVRGEVFDVTPFIDEHPGGFDIIISNTGKRENERECERWKEEGRRERESRFKQSTIASSFFRCSPSLFTSLFRASYRFSLHGKRRGDQ